MGRPKLDANSEGHTNRRWAYAALGSELAGSVLVPVLLGLWADSRYGWSPWGVVMGAVLGMIAGGVILGQLILRPNQTDR